jgi:GTP-binding protein EngB required for normal cell division
MVLPHLHKYTKHFFAVAHDIATRREQYRCPHFRILVIGRANAGKTTILEKVCGVAKGTHPMIIYDKIGKSNEIPCTFSYYVPCRGRTETF